MYTSNLGCFFSYIGIPIFCNISPICRYTHRNVLGYTSILGYFSCIQAYRYFRLFLDTGIPVFWGVSPLYRYTGISDFFPVYRYFRFFQYTGIPVFWDVSPVYRYTGISDFFRYTGIPVFWDLFRWKPYSLHFPLYRCKNWPFQTQEYILQSSLNI